MKKKVARLNSTEEAQKSGAPRRQSERSDLTSDGRDAATRRVRLEKGLVEK